MFSIHYKNDNPVAEILDDRDRTRKYVYLHNHDFDPENEKFTYKIMLKHGQRFVPCFDMRPNQVSRFYFCGRSGCGKSTFCNELVRQFYDQFEDAPKTLFFSNQEPEDFDVAYKQNSKKMKHITLDKEFVKTPPKIYDLAVKSEKGTYDDSLVIMDDWSCGDKKQGECIKRLVYDLNDNGRKLGIHQITINTDFPAMDVNFRRFMGNITGIVIFPKFMPSNLPPNLKKHFDIDEKFLEEMKHSCSSNWMFIGRNATIYIITEKMMMIYDPMKEKTRLKEVAKASK